MILYAHSYDALTNQIRIVPVEVEETEKTFRAAKSEFLYSHRVVSKTMLDELSRSYVYCMVSRHPRADYFKEKIIKSVEQQRKDAILIAEKHAAFLAHIEKSTPVMFPGNSTEAEK